MVTLFVVFLEKHSINGAEWPLLEFLLQIFPDSSYRIIDDVMERVFI